MEHFVPAVDRGIVHPYYSFRILLCRLQDLQDHERIGKDVQTEKIEVTNVSRFRKIYEQNYHQKKFINAGFNVGHSSPVRMFFRQQLQPKQRQQTGNGPAGQ